MSDDPTWPSPRIIYTQRYNIGFFGFERLHPFDSRKYGRAWKQLRARFGRSLTPFHIKPSHPIRTAELLNVHTANYLERLKNPKFLAKVLEIPQLKLIPAWVTDRIVLKPMRWATMGTLIAARQALDHGLTINMSGGYHHASPDDGHGFSVYADVGLAIDHLRRTQKLAEQDKVVYVDLDAHQGNGVCRTFFDDRRVFIYDQYNRDIFPMDIKAQRRIDCDVPVDRNCTENEYLALLKTRLSLFLDSITRAGDLRLAIYNAGTDVLDADKLGALNLSSTAVLTRDKFVLTELVERKIPTVILLSGGYSGQSYQLVVNMVAYILDTWGTTKIASD